MARKPVARVGDTHVCPITGHGTGTIVTGDKGWLTDGRPTTTVGSKTSCGATIIQGSPTASANGKAIAYVGCVTDHGGVITTGSKSATVDTTVANFTGRVGGGAGSGAMRGRQAQDTLSSATRNTPQNGTTSFQEKTNEDKFKLTSLPRIMRANGWEIGAQLMEKWFSGEAYTYPHNDSDDPSFNRDTSIVTLGWALGFPRAKAVYDSM